MIEEKAPYMIINYTLKVSETDFDWTKLDKWAEFEKSLFVYEVNKELYDKAHLIIDVLNGKIRKTLLINYKDQDVIEHYTKNYENNIITHVRKFFKTYPEAWESLVKTAKQIEDEITKE